MTQMLFDTKRETGREERGTGAREMETLMDELRRMLDQTFAGLTGWPAVRYADTWAPPVDVEETEDAYIVEAEVPGVQKEDVNVELIGNELTISGEVKEKKRTGVVRRSTRRSGRFAYWVTLPEPVNADNIDAQLRDGILTVTVPKAERAERRVVELKA
ncbi:MAG TPA: Hsp20/alpha crystallin family protein [Gaiellaceae bacterium]|jgi:HSP20 family protein|nr:Hsp20/alpha crystallin family protein [Gaiellaceae bacterium]